MIPSTTKNQIGALFNELLKLYPELNDISEHEYLDCQIYRDDCLFYISYGVARDDVATNGFESIIIGNCIKLLSDTYWHSNDDNSVYTVYNYLGHIISKESNLTLALLVALKIYADAK